MTKDEPASFNVVSYAPSGSLQKLLDELVTAARKMITHVGNIGILLNEIVKQGRNDGLLDIQTRQLVDFVLGENRTIRKYLPTELKKHKYPEHRKRMKEIGIDSNVEDNNLVEHSSTVESVGEMPRRELEYPLPETDSQDIEALDNKIDEQGLLIDDYKKTLKGKDELIAESDSKLRDQAQQIEMLSMQIEDYTDNLRETPEFQKATRQIEIAYEEQINHWRTECEKANEKCRAINDIPKIIEFSPNRLGCLDLIFENRDGILYLQHDGSTVIKVSSARPTEQDGKIAN